MKLRAVPFDFARYNTRMVLTIYSALPLSDKSTGAVITARFSPVIG
jgi:hypothetical protein